MLRLDIEGITAEEAKLYIMAGLKRKLDLTQQQIDLVSGESPAQPAKTAQKPAKTAQKPKKGTMSPEGRARLVAAQKKRWANVRKRAKLAKLAEGAASTSQAPAQEQNVA